MSPRRAIVSRRRRRLRSAIEAIEARSLLSSGVSVGSFSPASAALTTRIVVNTTGDWTDSVGSKTVTLRDAVEMAGNASVPVSISFDPAVFASHRTIQLVEGELELGGNTKPITIQGPSAGLNISGNGRILLVDAGVTATVSGINFENGQGDYGTIFGGGAINNSGDLTVKNSTISGNSGAGGGAIANYGNMFLGDCTIRSNTSYGTGGGIQNFGALTIQNSTVSLNKAEGGGGGGIESSGPLTIVDSTISGNTNTYGRGGGVNSSGIATISNSTISDNSTHSDFLQQYLGYGGGVANTGDIAITNSTISGNSTDIDGGGISNTYGGSAQLFDSTVTGNSAYLGGGIFTQAYDTFTIGNSIVAANQPFNPSDAQPDVSGDVSSSGHNLIGIVDDGSSGWIRSDFKGSAAFPINPRLSLLGFFGGPTETQYPLTGSLAKLAGSVALIPPGVTTDQRGYARVINGAVDIGAVELQHFATPVVMPAARQNVTAGNPASVALGTFVDPGGTGPFNVVVDWGDGSANTDFSLNSVGSLGNQTHTFIKTGLLTAEVFVRDARGDLSQPGAFPVFAATQSLLKVVVNTTSSQTHAAISDAVSLADAIDRADQRYGPVSIAFDPMVFAKTQTIVVPINPLHLQHNVFAPVYINGPSAGVILMGGGSTSMAVLQIDHGFNLSMNNVAVTGGTDNGIKNDGTLSLTHCAISNNQGVYGGAVNNTGTLTITGSTVTGNTANPIPGERGGYNGGYGGAIYNSGTLTISRCTISNNTSSYLSSNDATIDSNNGRLIVADSIISGNTGSGFATSAYPSTVANTRIVDNSDFGGDGNNLMMTGCDISGNVQGGLSLDNSALNNCTIWGNGSFGFVGGIEASDTVTITNCTIANNNSAGIFAFQNSDVSIYDTTVCGNSGTGVISSPAEFLEGAAIVRLANTIVDGNTDGTAGDSVDVSGVFSSQGFNLIGQIDGSSGWVKSDLLGTAAHPLLARLSPLGPNGGPTLTEVPLSGSPALNHGSNALIPVGVTLDQRGKPRIAHGIVDIGAVEVQSG